MEDHAVFPHFRHFTTFLLGLSATLFLCENEIRASRAFLEFRKSVLSYSDAMTKMLAQNTKCLQCKYDSMPDLGEIEVYLGSKFQSCFIDDFGMSGSLLQYWKYVTQI